MSFFSKSLTSVFNSTPFKLASVVALDNTSEPGFMLLIKGQNAVTAPAPANNPVAVFKIKSLRSGSSGKD